MKGSPFSRSHQYVTYLLDAAVTREWEHNQREKTLSEAADKLRKENYELKERLRKYEP